MLSLCGPGSGARGKATARRSGSARWSREGGTGATGRGLWARTKSPHQLIEVKDAEAGETSDHRRGEERGRTRVAVGHGVVRLGDDVEVSAGVAAAEDSAHAVKGNAAVRAERWDGLQPWRGGLGTFRTSWKSYSERSRHGETGLASSRMQVAEPPGSFEEFRMRMPKRALAAALMAVAALGTPAVAAPTPWDSHRIPAAAAASGESGTVSMLCSGNCYQ